MRRITAFITGAGLGASLVYLFDPRAGRSRRARIQDRFTRVAHETEHELAGRTRDLSNRLHGLFAEMAGRLEGGPVGDDTLVARVRSRMGRTVRSSHGIEVHAHDGWVSLSGPIASHEVQPLLRGIGRVRGVRGIENHLDVRPPQVEAPPPSESASSETPPPSTETPR